MTVPPDQPPPGGWPAPRGWGDAPWPHVPLDPPAGGPGLTLPPGWGQRPPTAPQPGVIPLRPLGLDDFFTGTFRTVRRAWRPMAAVSTLVAAMVALLGIPVVVHARGVVRALVETSTLEATTTDAELRASASELIDALVGFAPWLLYAVVIGLIAVAFIDAGIATIVSRAVLGRETSVRDALSVWARQAIPLFGLGLLMSASIVVGYLLCFIPGIVLSLMLFAAPSVLTLEQSSVTGAYQRSLQLTSKNFWRVIGILLLVQVLFSLTMQVIGSPLSFIAGFASLGSVSAAEVSDGSVSLLLASYVVLWLVSLAFYPLVSVGKALLYIDQRMRHEGLADALSAAATAASGTQK